MSSFAIKNPYFIIVCCLVIAIVGVQGKELHVEHVREPGQRVPVAGMTGAESPDCAMPIQPGQHRPILCDVIRVVEADEVVMEHRPIGS